MSNLNANKSGTNLMAIKEKELLLKRLQQMFDDILKTCSGNTRLCVATDLTLQTETVVTRPVSQWKNHKPSFKKRPTIFLIGK